jgi:RNA polymerase sigma-70 factor (ECF subfamily)
VTKASERSDEECVGSAQAGDRSAYSILVRRHQASLHRYLARMVGSHDEALDITQEAYVRAWQALPQREPGAQFRTWLFRIAANAALDVLRRRKAVEFVPLDETFEAADTAAGPERLAEGSQALRRLDAALARLAPEHREVLLLREIEGMSYDEIGRVLALSEGTVKSRLARARAALIEETGKDAP